MAARKSSAGAAIRPDACDRRRARHRQPRALRNPIASFTHGAAMIRLAAVCAGGALLSALMLAQAPSPPARGAAREVDEEAYRRTTLASRGSNSTTTQAPSRRSGALSRGVRISRLRASISASRCSTMGSSTRRRKRSSSRPRQLPPRHSRRSSLALLPERRVDSSDAGAAFQKVIDLDPHPTSAAASSLARCVSPNGGSLMRRRCSRPP